MSDLPDFYQGTSPGFPTAREGVEVGRRYWSGNIAANSFQCFTWFPFVEYKITTGGPTLITIGDAAPPAGTYFTANVLWPGLSYWTMLPPVTGYYRHDWLDFAASNAAAWNINLKVEALRWNGTTFTTIFDGIVPPGGIGFGIAGNFYADVLGVDWGPDKIELYTTAKGPQRYHLLRVESGGLNTLNYAAFRYEGSKEHTFAYNTSIGIPNYGFHEYIYNDNWTQRGFRRVFLYSFDEGMQP